MNVSIREFFSLAGLLNDQGKPLQRTRLVEDILHAYDHTVGTTCLITSRRQGKSSALSVVAAYELLCKPNSFVIWLSGSADQASDIISQKLTGPLKRNPSLRSAKLQLAADRITNLELGSTVEILPCNQATIPGRTVTALLADECRAIPEEVIELLRPSAAGGEDFLRRFAWKSGNLVSPFGHRTGRRRPGEALRRL